MDFATTHRYGVERMENWNDPEQEPSPTVVCPKSCTKYKGIIIPGFRRRCETSFVHPQNGYKGIPKTGSFPTFDRAFPLATARSTFGGLTGGSQAKRSTSWRAHVAVDQARQLRDTHTHTPKQRNVLLSNRSCDCCDSGVSARDPAKVPPFSTYLERIVMLEPDS